MGADEPRPVGCQICRADVTTVVMVLERSGIPPGEPGHAIAYSHTMMVRCGTCGGGTIEVRDYDSFDYEEVIDQYEWYICDTDSCDRLVSMATACPRSLDPACDCPVHQSLRIAVRRLPRRAWQFAIIEANAHLHRVVVTVDGTIIIEE